MASERKGDPISLIVNQTVTGRATKPVDMENWSAAQVVVRVPSGTTATFLVEGGDAQSDDWLTLPDANATQTGLTTSKRFDVACGARWLNVNVSAISGGGAVSVSVTPYDPPGLTNIAISGTTSENVSQWGGTATTLGQKAMAASVPVVVASDQSAVPSSNAASTQADGHSVTLGAIADGIVAAGAAGSLSAKLRRVTQGLEDLKSLIVLGTGSAIIGKVGIDQTAPGTTDHVSPISGQNGVAGGSGTVGASTQRVVLATDVALPTGTNTIGATKDAGPSWTQDFKFTNSADASSGIDATNAPTTGQKIVIDDLFISVGSTALVLTLEEETSGTDQMILDMAANSVVQLTPRGQWKLPTADKKLRLVASAAGNVRVRAHFHSEA